MMKYHNTSNKSIVRVALVTASSAGLGAATAKVLASEGFSVVINYLASKDKADRVVSDIEILQEDALEMTASMVPADITAETQVDADATTPAGPVSDSDSNSLHGGGGDQANHGRRVLAVQADMSKREDIQHVISTTITHFGRLDVVVSNQGWTCMRDFSDLDDNMVESDWDTCFNINVKSHLYLFHAAQPYLVATRGSFVSVASLAGVVPSGSSIVRTSYTSSCLSSLSFRFHGKKKEPNWEAESATAQSYTSLH